MSVTGCPGVNDSVIEVSVLHKSFRLECAVDYSGPGGAVDLSNFEARTLKECITGCAGNQYCTGCAWGRGEHENGATHVCYMKSTLGASHYAQADWVFAVLQ